MTNISVGEETYIVKSPEYFKCEEAVDNIISTMKTYDSKDSINKLYRMARIWTRIQWVYAKFISREDARELNYKLKVGMHEAKEQLLLRMKEGK